MHLDLHLCSSLSRHPAAKLHTLVLHGICKPNNQIECRAHSSGSICPVPNTSGTTLHIFAHASVSRGLSGSDFNVLCAVFPEDGAQGPPAKHKAHGSAEPWGRAWGLWLKRPDQHCPRKDGSAPQLEPLQSRKATKYKEKERKTPELTPAKLRLQLKDQGISAQGSVLEHTWTLLSSAKNMKKVSAGNISSGGCLQREGHPKGAGESLCFPLRLSLLFSGQLRYEGLQGHGEFLLRQTHTCHLTVGTSTIFTLMSKEGMLMLESSLVLTLPITCN